MLGLFMIFMPQSPFYLINRVTTDAVYIEMSPTSPIHTFQISTSKNSLLIQFWPSFMQVIPITDLLPMQQGRHLIRNHSDRSIEVCLPALQEIMTKRPKTDRSNDQLADRSEETQGSYTSYNYWSFVILRFFLLFFHRRTAKMTRKRA